MRKQPAHSRCSINTCYDPFGVSMVCAEDSFKGRKERMAAVIDSFTSFNKYFLSTYYVPETNIT